MYDDDEVDPLTIDWRATAATMQHEISSLTTQLARANAVIERVVAEVLLSADDVAIDLAHDFHFRYEEMAPEFGYVTNPRTAVPWEDLPADNKALMLAVAKRIWLDFVDVPLRTILEGNQ